MLKSIAIVGRPNVGKSTLFNRLAGKRLALVDATPGLTRDRREADAELLGVKVRLIDTAGLEEAEAGSIAERMRAQSERAIRQADLVLFVIDARAGVTGADRAFAAIARRSGRPVLLVANKCEGRAGSEGFYDAFSLGFGEAIAISAEHGEGILELERAILNSLGLDLPKSTRGKPRKSAGIAAEPAENDVRTDIGSAQGTAVAHSRPISIAIVGRPNAGKSTLVNTLLGEERMITGPEAGITRDAMGFDLDWQGRKVTVFDTAGLRRKSRISEKAEKLAVSDALNVVKYAEVVVLLVDAEHPLEKQDLQIAQHVTDEGRALVIALNKWDLIEDRQQRLQAIRAAAEHMLPQVKGVPLVPISGQSGSGLDTLMEWVFAVYAAWNRRVPTAHLNRWIAEATARHAPPAASGRRIKLRYVTQTSTRPPTFVAFCSKPEALPESYVRYLVNSLRETFDMTAVPIRLHIRKGENPYARAR
jgi:GTP-binding protein